MARLIDLPHVAILLMGDVHQSQKMTASGTSLYPFNCPIVYTNCDVYVFAVQPSVEEMPSSSLPEPRRLISRSRVSTLLKTLLCRRT